MDESMAFIDVYNKICSVKSKYGIYHKTLFHLHTPASYDYKLLEGWKPEDFLQVTENQLVELCLKKKVLPNM